MSKHMHHAGGHPGGMPGSAGNPISGHPGQAEDGKHRGHPGGHGMSAPLRTLEDGSPACRLIAWEVTRSCNLACKHCRADRKSVV